MANRPSQSDLCAFTRPHQGAWLAFWAGIAGLAILTTGSLTTVVADEKKPDKPATQSFPPEAVEFFESRVRPILAERCLKCHGPAKQSNGLRLDSREAVLKGGDSGPAVVPARPDDSLLIKAVSHSSEDLKMPPTGKLPDPALAALRQWVTLGLPWAPDRAQAPTPGQTTAAVSSTHWAFQPVRRVSPPVVKDRAWVGTRIDVFILAKLEAAGITPSAPADKRTLIRRATIDLLGIPPTADEIAAFVADQAPDAYARLVDRLLASPHYGERWGRHWLDVARYADTKGYVFTEDRRYPFAYTYRDYVIAAFNHDVGYDKFIVEQLAADQLARSDDPRALAAMGFLTVGRRFLQDQNEIIDDRIDTVCRGFLGLTVTCARCHDHKFDPIPSEDYYSLYGVFASSVEPAELPIVYRPGGSQVAADFDRKLGLANRKRDDYLAARRDEFLTDVKARFAQYLKAASDLNFERRSGRLDERALADKLNSRRLRAVISLWKHHLDAPAPPSDPVLGPWRAFSALPANEFAAKAGDVHGKLTVSKGAAPASVHPLVAKAVLASPPKTMAEVVARYVELFAELDAKCHDHAAKSPAKTALPEPEWESLRQAIFGSGGPLAVSVEGMKMLLDQSQRGRLNEFDGEIARINGTHPGAPARAMVLVDAPKLVDPHVFVRGNPGRPGAAVPRRFLKLLSGAERAPFAKGSGRLDLARAIADANNPLTARVLVNRAWQWHFGKALVTTPSDFGVRSDLPSHPELLDDLALEFMASGWSLKTLHRRIMLSSTYQQSSLPRPAALERDPENRLVWRFNRQRLDFEAMRDSLLAVSGALDRKIGGPPVVGTEPASATSRTIYGFIDRQNLDGVYRAFDFAVPDATSPRRFVTTVPQQALFLMNSPFLHQQAKRLAAMIAPDIREASPTPASAAASDPADQVRGLYRRVLGRLPEPDELDLAVAFVKQETARLTGDLAAWKQAPAGKSTRPLSPWEQLAQVLLLTNEFMFVD
jgi:Protein of unknown function (DUF1553)/Protein of unknown function (DUF1549)/Planctomycete cytochrome C